MGPLRRFEDRLEKIFEGPFTKAFKGGVHPLEIARRMIRELDDGRVLGVNETLAPNDFKVYLSPRDYDRLSGMLDSLTVEMESLIIAYSNKRDYHLITRPRFEFEPDASLDEGEFSVRAVLDEPARAQPPAGMEGEGPWSAYSESHLGVLVILRGKKEGFSYTLERARTRIGRADENDLVLDDLRASRFHAEIERTPRGYVVRDLGSTNGTMVGGRIVQERLLEDGDTLTMGETEMRFNFVAGGRER
jgi:hypothetical protein